MSKDLCLRVPRLSALILVPSEDPIVPEQIEIHEEAKKLVKRTLVQTTIIGKSLSSLNTDLESLIFDHCYSQYTTHMCKAIKRLRSL